MRDYLSKKIGKQALAGLVVFLAFPLLYFGSQNGNYPLITVGMSMVVVGVAATPIIDLIHRKKSKREQS